MFAKFCSDLAKNHPYLMNAFPDLALESFRWHIPKASAVQGLDQIV